MKKIFVAILMLITVSLLLIGCEKSSSNYSDSKSTSDHKPIEFQYTKKELKAIGKWKKKTYDDMLDDALNGDPSAMYMMGFSSLYGIENALDVKQADLFFALAASLGHAPSLDQMRATCLESDNLFLTLVYINLTISFGHQEYRELYFQKRSQIIKRLGKQGKIIFDEIENIARKKRNQIIENQIALKKEGNKREFVIGLIGNEITKDDIFYDMKYWEQLGQSAPIKTTGNK